MPAAPDALQDLADSLEPYLSGTDESAIHDDVADEITQITLKAAPAVDDVLLIEDTSDAAAKKSITIGTLAAVAGQVSLLDAAVPLITDKFAFEDQSDSDIMKEATIQEIMGAAGWVTGLAAKAAPTVADKIAIEDAADSAAMKESTIQQVMAAVAWIDGLTAKGTPIGADLVAISDSAAAGATKKATINTLPILQAQVVSVVSQPAADAAVEIDGTIGGLQLTVTGAGNVAISTNANCYAGQKVNLFAIAVAGGGSYTLALDVGTLTLNASGESAVVQRNAGDTAWVCCGLSGATIV
jgi:hypothetical protein